MPRTSRRLLTNCRASTTMFITPSHIQDFVYWIIHHHQYLTSHLTATTKDNPYPLTSTNIASCNATSMIPITMLSSGRKRRHPQSLLPWITHKRTCRKRTLWTCPITRTAPLGDLLVKNGPSFEYQGQLTLTSMNACQRHQKLRCLQALEAIAKDTVLKVRPVPSPPHSV